MNDKFLKEHLHECLRLEVMKSDKQFSWIRTIHKAIKCPERRFNFWWRIASHLNRNGGKLNSKLARRINVKLQRKYSIDIGLEAWIGKGLKINHGFGIVVRNEFTAGDFLTLRQCTTIGKKKSGKSSGSITIGSNVDIGANVCILGDINIGDDVVIGAMSFINKDIPEGCTAYCLRSATLTFR